MKILRTLRRRKIRLSFILVLLVVFIFNSYAWISFQRDDQLSGLVATVSTWGVEFVVDDEPIKQETYTFDIEEFYPSIAPIEKKVDVYNIGEANSNLTYQITDIYLYGEQIYRYEIDEKTAIPETIGEPVTAEDGSVTTNAFGNKSAMIFDAANKQYSFSLRYPTPFTITYTYDKNYVSGMDREPSSKATMTINLEWYNNEENNDEDTKLGLMAYDFRITNPDEPALKIVATITAKRAEI